MIEIKNLRIEDTSDGWSRVAVDVNFEGMDDLYNGEGIWFSTPSKNKHMLSESYDAFLLVPLYIAMSYKQDLYIRGKVSKRLYKNVMTYVQTILCEYSERLSKVNVFVDGFSDTTNQIKSGGGVIGTSFSCGIDSLTTIYDCYVNEQDEDYKINALFLFDCGTHGVYQDPKSHEAYNQEYIYNKPAADELGLPVHQVKSNVHAFMGNIKDFQLDKLHGRGIFNGGSWGTFAMFSCIFALQNGINKYYQPNTYEYEEIKDWGKYSRNYDITKFSECYLVPLLQTESVELITYGCQYTRTQKTEHISDWHIMKKYLNFGCKKNGILCGHCSKCTRALCILDVMGKIEEFSTTFDLKAYRKKLFIKKCHLKYNAITASTYTAGALEIVEYYKTHKNNTMPSAFTASIYMFFYRARRKIARMLKM